MSTLSDRDIRAALERCEITISDFDPDRLQPCTYDVKLGNKFLKFDYSKITRMDPRVDYSDCMMPVDLNKEGEVEIDPYGFVLGAVDDRIGVDRRHHCEILGKSSIARLGLVIHATAGFIDPGNELNITLEFFNMNPVPFVLIPGMKISQILFTETSSPVDRCYGHPGLDSKYFGSSTVEASQMFKNFQK